MITEHDLAEAIAECEGQRNPNASTCLKLAAFYTIRENMYPEKKEEPVSYSRAEGPIMEIGSKSKVEYESETQFGQAIAGMSVKELMPVMDELMTAVRVISPRLYDGVMRKIDPMY